MSSRGTPYSAALAIISAAIAHLSSASAGKPPFPRVNPITWALYFAAISIMTNLSGSFEVEFIRGLPHSLLWTWSPASRADAFVVSRQSGQWTFSWMLSTIHFIKSSPFSSAGPILTSIKCAPAFHCASESSWTGLGSRAFIEVKFWIIT